MNQKQREFLIAEITKNTELQVRELSSSKPEKPNLENYIIQGLLSGNISLKSSDSIKEYFINLIKNATGSSSLLESGRWNEPQGDTIKIPAKVLFEYPKEYLDRIESWKQESIEIDKKIDSLKSSSKGLIVRINLASSRTLELMINEVDNMGQISLMDNTLRKITGLESVDKEKEKENKYLP